MEIHEITKGSRRTDEGILDGVKKAVSAAKTGYNVAKTGYNAAKTVGNAVVGAAKASINKASAGYDKWADAEREKEHNKRQEKINRSVEKSTASLRRQGYDPNPHNLPLSAAGTKANIDAGTAGPQFKAKVALQKFMSQFVGPNMPAGGVGNNPATANPATANPATANPATAQTTKVPTKSATKTTRKPTTSTPAVPPGSRKRFKQMVNQFGAQPTPPITTSTGGIAQSTPTGTRHTASPTNLNTPRKGRKKTTESTEFLTEIYNIQRDFPGWIDREIPGLAAARQDETIAKALDDALAKLVAAQGNPTALQSAFSSYYSIASQAVKDNPHGNTSDNDSPNSQFSYAQNDVIQNLKLDPKIVASLKQKLDNREITPKALIDYIKNYQAY
jgi:hypothetical protein